MCGAVDFLPHQVFKIGGNMLGSQQEAWTENASFLTQENDNVA